MFTTVVLIIILLPCMAESTNNTTTRLIKLNTNSVTVIQSEEWSFINTNYSTTSNCLTEENINMSLNKDKSKLTRSENDQTVVNKDVHVEVQTGHIRFNNSEIEHEQLVENQTNMPILATEKSLLQIHHKTNGSNQEANHGSVITNDNDEDFTKQKYLTKKKKIHKRFVKNKRRDLKISTQDYFIWPDLIEKTSTTSVVTNTSLPLEQDDIIDKTLQIFNIKGHGSESDEDHRIITTLLHSQKRLEPTIVELTMAQARDFPFFVSLKRTAQKLSDIRKVWVNYCGGSIIKPKNVLTAAHCFEMNKYDYYYHPKKLLVVAGSLVNRIQHSGNNTNSKEHQVRQIKWVKLHRDFNFPLNDIAMVFVAEPFLFNNPMLVNYVLPARYQIDYGSQCYVAGFGQAERRRRAERFEELLYAEISLMSRQQCNEIWEMEMNTFLCSHNILRGVTGGDSGGPVVCFNSLDPSAKMGSGKLLVGIVSGRNYDKTPLFTRVSAYRQWIDSNSACVIELNIALLLFLLIKVFCTMYG